MTALILYYNIANSTTTGLTTTANVLIENNSAGALTTKTTTTGTATGWFEVTARASTGSSGGSQGSQTGNGFIDDGTTLEGNTLAAGVWLPSIRVQAVDGTIVCDWHLRASKRSSGGVYTTIGDFVNAGISITTSLATFSTGWTGTSQTSMAFTTGDKLYIEHWASISSNGGTAANGIKLGEASAANTGIASSSVGTPGYGVTGSVHFFICDGMGGVFS